MNRLLMGMAVVMVMLGLSGCSRVGEEVRARSGDEIVVCGRLFHTGGAPVVLWTDPGGYDAYRTERRFVPWADAAWNPASGGRGPETAARYGVRYGKRTDADRATLNDEDFERIRGGGWDLETLRGVVDQFVLHYDVCGTSRQCFRVLHDVRGLSVHFMLDIDGTIYQTMDLKERAWHATTSNDRSVGIEIANIGAYPRGRMEALDRWYEPDATELMGNERTDSKSRGARITIPESMGDGGVRRAGTYRPRGGVPVVGVVQGEELVQFDLTEEQYRSLERLTAALCRVLPGIRREYPRDAGGELVRDALKEEELAEFSGVLGHWHIQANKTDPGPALDWERVVGY